jgi:AraC family L-rhamnose operon transcriptional activator RhaR
MCRLRLERAKRLLVESDKQIKEVAKECGFASAHYFSEAFVNAEGFSPGEHRRRHR